MTARALLCLALATLSGGSGAGCSVAGLSERDASIAINQCGPDNSCPDGQVCSNIGCVGTSGTLSTLLFEVSPGVAANNAAGAQFFMREDTIPLVPTATSLGGTFPRQFFSLALNEVVSVAGSLNAATCSVSLDGSDTIITNASIPARVTFAPTERMWGLATTSLTVSSAGDDHSFRASLPGGTYDVYVEPLGAAARDSAPSKSCAVLPQLFRAQDLKSSTSLKLSLPAPKRLELQVLFPEGNQNLDGWHLDVVEPVTGRVVSNDVELHSPAHDAGTLGGTGTIPGVVTVNPGALVRGDAGTGTGTLTLNGATTVTGAANGGGGIATQLTVSGGAITANSKLANGGSLAFDTTNGKVVIRVLNDAGLTPDTLYSNVTLVSGTGPPRPFAPGSSRPEGARLSAE